MIIILVKGNHSYSTCLFDSKLEDLITSKTPADEPIIIKKLCKEFDIKPDNIHKYWVIPEWKDTEMYPFFLLLTGHKGTTFQDSSYGPAKNSSNQGHNIGMVYNKVYSVWNDSNYNKQNCIPKLD